ncbi:MAG: hypothetical protein ACFFCW_20855, partial [Candidatus Hodarchaeota archaeon]
WKDGPRNGGQLAGYYGIDTVSEIRRRRTSVRTKNCILIAILICLVPLCGMPASVAKARI